MKCTECAPKGLKGLTWEFGKCDECGNKALVADTSFHETLQDQDVADLFSNIMGQ